MGGHLVLVPFDGGDVARWALGVACDAARSDGATVLALYVVRIPRQLPLAAELPGLARDLARVQLAAKQVGDDAGVAVWAEWVYAREVARAVADVAAELQARQILLGVRRPRLLPGWRRPWSLASRVGRLARCAVVVRSVPAPALAEGRQPSVVGD